MTTVRRETGRELHVEEVMNAIADSFEEVFRVHFRDDQPDTWEQETISRLEVFRVHFRDDQPDTWEQETISRLIRERYTRESWIFSHKHPRSRMGIGRVKTRGGLLEVYLSLAGGSIENVVITGDFFSTPERINRIENALKWTSARKERIENSLASVWEEEMIYGIDVPTLTTAILKAKENQVRL
ncbi:MAG: hypothetical protein B1H13_13625 [Desulfobacteraceae bacterium 4484_190.3]|nr:MAG: hypothetical protein B1H13_13625 [Desulfobacteraceae bacterium 4484_190.3]